MSFEATEPEWVRARSDRATYTAGDVARMRYAQRLRDGHHDEVILEMAGSIEYLQRTVENMGTLFQSMNTTVIRLTVPVASLPLSEVRASKSRAVGVGVAVPPAPPARGECFRAKVVRRPVADSVWLFLGSLGRDNRCPVYRSAVMFLQWFLGEKFGVGTRAVAFLWLLKMSKEA